MAGKMTRVDTLRANNGEANGAAAPVCEATRNVQKNCNAGKKAERKQKDKGQLRRTFEVVNFEYIKFLPGGRKGRQ